MMILIMLITKVLEITKNDSTIQIMLSILITLGPFLLMRQLMKHTVNAL